MGGDFGFPGAFMHLSTSEHTIESEATILVDRRKSVKVEVPIPDACSVLGQCR